MSMRDECYMYIEQSANDTHDDTDTNDDTHEDMVNEDTGQLTLMILGCWSPK